MTDRAWHRPGPASKGVPFEIPTVKLPPSPRLAGFGFPLKDYAAKHGQTWLSPEMLPC
jgi:hypothetical protein